MGNRCCRCYLLEDGGIEYASSSSEPQRSNRRKTVQLGSNKETGQLNDSVYELYKPSSPTKPDMDLVFFHGLQLEDVNGSSEAHFHTWRSRDSLEVWPQHWLPEEFPHARILSISYDAGINLTHTSGRMDLYLVAESLLRCLMLCGVGQSQPVILVGHDFGGLVIKQCCIQAGKRRDETEDLKEKNFLENVRGIFYFGTPHKGYLREFVDAIGKSRTLDGELVKYGKVFNADAARLHEEFETLSKDFKWKIFGVGESRPSLLDIGFCDVVVPEASARGNNSFCILEEDHFSMCKPSSKTTTSYTLFLQFVRDIYAQVPKHEVFHENWQRVPIMQVQARSEEEVEVLQCLKTVRIVGLWGMGGIGKTTMAKRLFNSLCTSFEYTLFASEVKLIEGTSDDLETILLQRIHHRGRRMADTTKWEMLRNKKLLVVLDDIQSGRDFEILAKLFHPDFGPAPAPESRFLLTCRDRNVLEEIGISSMKIHEVKFLDQENSVQLFKDYASLGEDQCPSVDAGYLERIVKKCDGLPLTIEVMGKNVRTNEINVCEQILEALERADSVGDLGQKVWSKLRLSYDLLPSNEQGMFLDVAFFSDLHVDLYEVKAFWRALYGPYEEIHWNTLVKKSLVYNVEEDEGIRMHEQLKDLGLKIGNELKNGKRLCVKNENNHSDILHEIRDHPENIRILMSQGNLSEEMREHYRVIMANLHQMKELRWLELRDCDFSVNEVILPPKLLVFEGIGIETNISFASCVKLSILDLADCRDSFSHTLRELQILLLHNSREILPNVFGNLKQLKIFGLVGCSKVETLPDSFGKLEVLRVLSIKNCEGLLSLSNSFGHLKQLKEFQLVGCSKVETLPDSFGKLEVLQVLYISCCEGLLSLPDSFGDLKQLKEFHLVGCSKVETLPDSFGKLEVLQVLYIDCCEGLLSLPDSFGDLKQLKEFRLEGCSKVETLPISFDKLEVLQVLNIYNCEGLLSLPDSFGHLKQLKEFRLVWCSKVETLPDSFGKLEVLQVLYINCCDDLLSLPDSFGHLKQLKNFWLVGCSKVETLPDSFGKLEVLQFLNIENCEGLLSLPDSFGDLKQLKEFRLEGCSKVETLPDSFGKLEVLQDLYIDCCEGLLSLPDTFGHLKQLKEFQLVGCSKIETLPDSFGKLEVLQVLYIDYCEGLLSLPDSFGDLKQLKEFRLEGCSKVETLPDSFGKLEVLQDLYIDYCESLLSLPDSFGHLIQLVN